MKTNMMKGLAFFFLICLALTSCKSEPTDVSKEIQEANNGFMEAFNKGDANGVAMLYTSNGKLLPPNSDVVEGQKAIEEFWAGVIDMGIKKADLETMTATCYGAIAIEEGRFKIYNADGDMVDQGKYIVEWVNENKKWKLSRDIWNSSNPAPQPEAPAMESPEE